jgi:serine/threonine protein kinase
LLLKKLFFLVTPDIETLLRQGGRTSVQAPIVSAMLEHYGSQVAYAVSSRQINVLEDYYVKASKIPKTSTMRAIGCEGYIMNGPLHGNENLIICFDLEAKPHLLKRLNNEDERHRVYCFSQRKFCHPHVTSFEFRSGGGELAAMIMPIFPSTLHSLTLNQGNSKIIGKLISQISEALEALHAIGYCHMDIKPSNIAIDNEGNFVLIDLGSVAPIGEPTESTDLYLPSEDGGTYGRYIATEKRDWLMLAITVYSKLNSSNWDGQNKISSNHLITYLQSCEYTNSLVVKINRT